jgi:hypothetical protein
MESIGHSEAKSQRARLRDRLIGRFAVAHCQTAALHGFCREDLQEAKLNVDGYLDPKRVEALQLQAEGTIRLLAQLAALNLSIKNLPPEGYEELGAVAVYALAAVAPVGEALS